MSAANVTPDRLSIRALLRRPVIFAALLLAIGMYLVIEGAQLVLSGGSSYYVLCGVAVVSSAALLAAGRRLGAWIYAAMVLGTLGWAFWEVGLDGWQLMPRIIGPAVLGLWLLVPRTRRALLPDKISQWLERRLKWQWPVLVLIVCAAGVGLHQTRKFPQDPIEQRGRAPAPATNVMSSNVNVGAADEWRAYGGNNGGMRFSTLHDITPVNVEKLRKLWSYRVGATPQGKQATLEAVPIVVDNRFFVCTSVNEIIALDANTGRKIWRFDPKVKWKSTGRAVCRGVSYFEDPDDPDGVCGKRIIGGTIDARLVAVDARSGRPCRDFGDNGQVSLLTGMGDVRPGYYYVSSAPTIVRGKIIVGGWVADGQYWGEPSGVIRAFDARTGAFNWAFDVGRPERTGEPQPGDQYTDSTPNSWSVMSGDEQLGLVYAPMGNATPDYYGAQRRSFDDKFSSGTAAIDVETGKLRWFLQTTHHDVWDYDVASQPTLVDIPDGGGGVRHALIQPTKRGEVFVVDRETGKPIFGVDEVASPQAGAAPGERLAATQPYSVEMPSFRGRDLIESDMWGITPLDQLWCRLQFKRARYEGPMTPPGLTPWIQYPGYLGGSNWGSVSVNPDRMLMTIAVNHMGNYNQLLTRREANKRRLAPMVESVGGAVAQLGTPYAAAIGPFMSPLAMPCQAPPFGTISAVDLTSGKLVWTRKLGNSLDNGPFGIRFPLAIAMGTPNIGGNLNTRGGLTFIAATTDSMFRAFDTATGTPLWETRLPAAGLSTPISYRAADGRQVVAISAAGANGLGGRTGDYIVAYALPPVR